MDRNHQTNSNQTANLRSSKAWSLTVARATDRFRQRKDYQAGTWDAGSRAENNIIRVIQGLNLGFEPGQEILNG
jgi:hypothetical protein